jgi:cytochrome c554/c'-like protein
MIRFRIAILLAFAGLSFSSFTTPVHSDSEAGLPPYRANYAGDTSCVACHQSEARSYEHTSHHLTSQLPTPQSVLGRFKKGVNTLIIAPAAQSSLPGLQFVMDAEPDGYFITASTGWPPAVYRRKERIDLVTGSGVRGQTYLYWQGDRLYELPVSYWTDGHRWVNSPGYIDGTAEFSRPINPACLECHATYIRPLSTDPSTNRFDRLSLVPGISCESCHGPGANHVKLAKAQQLKAGKSTGILNPASFSRDRQVDLCAECHNGIQREPLRPAFSYVPGEPLADYYRPLPAPDVEHPDVHGNQVGLLQRSKCFRSSPQMSCSTCHNVHTNGQPAESYSAKCLGCHQWQACGMAAKIGHDIVKNCIDCHMPVEQTSVIASETAGQVVHARMRNHWIKVYPPAAPPKAAAE